MSKKLNTDHIRNELQGSAFFPTKVSNAKEEQSNTNTNGRTDNRTENRTVERTETVTRDNSGKAKSGSLLLDDLKSPKNNRASVRRTKRYSFEAYEDQIEAIEELQSQHKKRTGKKFSASELIREALDLYFKELKGE